MRLARNDSEHRRQCPHCESWFSASKSVCPVCRKLADAAPAPSDLLALAPSLDSLDKCVEPERLVSGPWDHVFGGGIAKTSVALLASEAGAGKTTICFQMSDAIARAYGRKVLFISVEMIREEATFYAKRLELTEFHNIHLMSLKLDIEPLAQLEDLLAVLQPAFVVLDSVSDLSKGDLAAEVKMCAKAKRLATLFRAPWVIISHINKDGEFSGLQKLQHEVDTLLSLSVEADGKRILECPTKNRFGRTPAFVTFAMNERGRLVPLARRARSVSADEDETSTEDMDDEDLDGEDIDEEEDLDGEPPHEGIEDSEDDGEYVNAESEDGR